MRGGRVTSDHGGRLHQRSGSWTHHPPPLPKTIRSNNTQSCCKVWIQRPPDTATGRLVRALAEMVWQPLASYTPAHATHQHFLSRGSPREVLRERPEPDCPSRRLGSATVHPSENERVLWTWPRSEDEKRPAIATADGRPGPLCPDGGRARDSSTYHWSPATAPILSRSPTRLCWASHVEAGSSRGSAAQSPAGPAHPALPRPQLPSPAPARVSTAHSSFSAPVTQGASTRSNPHPAKDRRSAAPIRQRKTDPTFQVSLETGQTGLNAGLVGHCSPPRPLVTKV